MTKTASQKARAKGNNQSQPKTKKVQAQPTVQKTKQSKRKGKGGSSTIGSILREGGGLLGSLVGAPTLGRKVGDGLAKVFGQGDYTVQENSLMTNQIPVFGEYMAPIRVQFRELVTLVKSQTSYGVSYALPLNPGLMTPILASLARTFTFYKFHGLLFAYKPLAYEAVTGTNNSSGMLGMVVNYDPTEPNYTDRVKAEQATGSQVGRPSDRLLLPVECKDESTLFGKRYVRTTEVANTDKTLTETDYGKFQLFGDASQASVSVGELWVTYDVELFNPAPAQSGVSVFPDIYRIGKDADNRTYPLGPAYYTPTPVFQQYSKADSTGISFLTRGTYKVDLYARTGLATTLSTSITYYNGVSSISGFNPDGNTNSNAPFDASTSTTARSFTFYVKVESDFNGALPRISWVTNASGTHVGYTYITLTRVSTETIDNTPLSMAKRLTPQDMKIEQLGHDIDQLKALLQAKQAKESPPPEKESLDEEMPRLVVKEQLSREAEPSYEQL
jgi:hypothetical protein